MDRSAVFNASRQREYELMQLLARIATGDRSVMRAQDERGLRQLGYAASLVHGHVDDPDDNLGAAVCLAAGKLKGKTSAATSFRDPVQAKWGAPRHLDAAKLRRETPLHLLKLRREGSW